ncbi:glycosyltransferase [Sulfurimonas sp. CVO]|uniref:glycosyltransferase family 4 protein n=1 Tax=Sulfurimonas sp. CVO TaxID=2283483 RepID=UPI00132EDA39|nr:glycosyltransferase family 4 protein [Sulfurimonas sp. CVO]QHG91854.1 glycosyltransferase [Sulfurimonas sp. CVO]
MKKIFLLGPLLPPVHGQSLAFTRFVESIEESEKIVVNTNLEDKSKLGKIFGTFKTLFFISVKALFSKYDVVYFTCSRSMLGSIKDIVLINLVSLRGVQIVNHLHGSDFYEFLHSSPKWYQKILFKSYEKVDTSIVLLDSMKLQFGDFERMKVEVIPNFYDKELDEKLVEKDASKTNLVYLSNIMSSKGIFELIDAFEKLSKKYDDICLSIAGGYIADEYMNIDEVKEMFESKISQNDKIKYIGKTFGEDKVKLLQSSDIFVLPSYYKSEAFPISIIEAMACENAIVTTNYKYLPEVVNSKNGVLVEPKSVESLVEGIECLINDKEKLKQIQKYNKKEAKEKYSLGRYIKSLKQIVMES